MINVLGHLLERTKLFKCQTSVHFDSDIEDSHETPSKFSHSPIIIVLLHLSFLNYKITHPVHLHQSQKPLFQYWHEYLNDL